MNIDTGPTVPTVFTSWYLYVPYFNYPNLRFSAGIPSDANVRYNRVVNFQFEYLHKNQIPLGNLNPFPVPVPVPT